VSAGVWVLYEARVVVSEVVAAEVAAVVGSDVAVATGDSGCERRGQGVCRSAVGRAGSECRRFRGAGDCFGVGKVVVVVVVDDVATVDGSVDVADGGCVGIVNGDVADGSGDATLGMASSSCSKVVIADSADIRISSLEFCCISSAFVSGFGQGVERARETTRRAQNR
jgi:hypothetical protein